MINDILKKHPNGFEQLLNLLLDSKLSEELQYTDYFEIEIDMLFYISSLCGAHWDDETESAQYTDGLVKIMVNLKDLGVIDKFIKKQYTKLDKDKYDIGDLINDYFLDPETGLIENDAPIEEAKLFLQHSGPYYVKCDKEKVKLFLEIIYKKKKYLCTIGTLKYLVSYAIEQSDGWSCRIDLDSFIDWVKPEKKYFFYDIEVFIYSMASSSRLNLARMYYYLMSQDPTSKDIDKFKSLLNLEEEVVLGNAEYSYPDRYKNYYFDASKDEEINGNKLSITEYISNGMISYDQKGKLLKIGNVSVPFKGAKLQITFIEYLLKNKERSISSKETSTLGIKDIKITIEDIKKKMKKYGISQKQCKDIFHYYEDEGVKYCRILL